MKSASIAALLLLTLASISHAEPKAAPAPKIPAVPSADAFTALRMAYAAQPDFSPYWNIDPDREAVMDAVKSKDFPKAIALAKTWLEKVPVDAEVHYLRAHFLKKAGDIAGSMHHFHCFYGLMRSITATGDGKTAATAWKVIAVSEEYALLHEIDAELIDQTLVDSCDKMHIKLSNGTETDLYFDVSISLAATARQFAPGKK
jgi:hypothetical protein